MLSQPFANDEDSEICKRYRNKFYEEKYTVESQKYRLKPKRLAIFSDIHYQVHISKQIYKLLYFYVKKTKPDYVIFPGDIFENDSFLEDREAREFFIKLITSIAEICPVILTLGNHDIHNLNIKSYLLDSGEDTIEIIKFLDGLNKIKNVYFLNNEQINLDGINFVSFCPTYDTYRWGISKKATDLFMDEYVKGNFKLDSNEFNVLLSHNPLLFSSSDAYKDISDLNNKTDLIISGHMHNGYIPRYLYEKLKNTNVGMFFYPVLLPFPGVPCRGMHKIGRGKLFISKCYRKWTTDVKLFNYLEESTANDVEELTLCGEEMQRKLTL